MRFNKAAIASFCVLSLAFTACGPNKLTIANKALSDANTLAQQDKYAEAFSKYVEAGELAAWDSVSWRYATIAASAIKQDSAAVVWGYKTSSTGDKVKLTALSNSLIRLGKDVERESLILSDTASFFSIIGIQPVLAIKANRLAESNSTELLSLYPRLTDNDAKAKVFDSYFKMAKKTESDKVLESACKEILKADPNQTTALLYLGTSRYDSAEKKYAKLMNDYNKNKTQAAYAYLTRDLKKVVTPLYKESRDYFERLRKIDSENKTYIKYLININDRLSNESEVKKLKKLL